MITTDAQVRKLMKELSEHGEIGLASARAGMDRKTGRKYRDAGRLPSQLKQPRTWRTREDPFAGVWEEIAARLKDAPELEAKTLFEDLLSREPERFGPGQLRTLQRRIREWRALEGPNKEVFFAQQHRPGEAMQTDFTWANELAVTVAGEPFEHMLCHSVLPYSNWESATTCRSESYAALRRGFQMAVFRLGRVPEWHQTDNSTGATHDLPSGKREFNATYRRLMDHFGVKPRTIEPGKKEQNGDVESLNGALKRRLTQHLALRGSRDFESVDAYEAWLWEVCTKANGLRAARLAEELAVMRPVAVQRLPEHSEQDVLVTGWSTIRVSHNAYSVPSRLIGETVRVRLYEDRLDVFYAQRHQLTIERLQGRNGHRINYRHVIWSLVKKPRAFAQYRYREDLFPSLVFRKAYDSLLENNPAREAELEYLRVLHLAASTMESEVSTALELFLVDNGVASADEVKALVSPARTEVPELAAPAVDLTGYDALLNPSEEVAS